MSLFITAKGDDKKYRIIVIFGVGVIGSAIAEGLRSVDSAVYKQLSYNWFDIEKQKRQLKITEEDIANFLNSYSVSAIHIIWCAGKAGFSSNEQETELELDNYKRILRFAQNLATMFHDNLFVYHTISSAGGLFEGQRHVTTETGTAPKRPYGRLKIKQENALYEIERLETFKKRIYRPSSVYTYIIPGQRWGLIPTLIINGIRQNVSFMTGSLTTIRDYIYAPDIGRFFAKSLMENAFSEDVEINFLISGKPTTIHEIINNVERIINKKLYVNYSINKTNEEDISFTPSLIPKKFEKTDIRTAITLIFNKLIESGASQKNG